MFAPRRRHHRSAHPSAVQGGGDGRACAGYGFEIVIAALAVLVTVCALALLFPPGVGREISFSAPYQPRPEWYFLWFYQAARALPGAWAFWGLVLLPAAFFAGIFFLPTLDGDTGRGRRLALALCALTGLVFLSLTLLALFG